MNERSNKKEKNKRNVILTQKYFSKAHKAKTKNKNKRTKKRTKSNHLMDLSAFAANELNNWRKKNPFNA